MAAARAHGRRHGERAGCCSCCSPRAARSTAPVQRSARRRRRRRRRRRTHRPDHALTRTAARTRRSLLATGWSSTAAPRTRPGTFTGWSTARPTPTCRPPPPYPPPSRHTCTTLPQGPSECVFASRAVRRLTTVPVPVARGVRGIVWCVGEQAVPQITEVTDPAFDLDNSTVALSDFASQGVDSAGAPPSRRLCSHSIITHRLTPSKPILVSRHGVSRCITALTVTGLKVASRVAALCVP